MFQIKKSLQIVARYNKSLKDLSTNRSIISKLQNIWNGQIYPFKSIHKSKGLEADYLVLLDLDSRQNGFPSLKEDDPIIKLLLSQEEDYIFAEERRIFYVALTRAKEQVHLLADESAKSVFAVELSNKKYDLNIFRT